MSYDLAFWRDTRDVRPKPSEIYNALLESDQVPGIEPIPIDQILTALVATFPAAVREPNGADEWITWTSSTGEGGFEVSWSDQHVLVNLRGIDTETGNAIVDLCVSRGTRLYDPQTDERFDSV